MNIAIIGAGGIGGYFGGRIADAGYTVTFVARGAHYEAIKTKGLHVKSIKGDFKIMPKVVDSINKLEAPDLVLLGVKSWQVKAVAEQLKPIISENTMVLPLQNGATNAETLQEVLPNTNVLAGLCKIVSKIEAAGVINHFAFEPEIVFGEYSNALSERIKRVKTVFDTAVVKNRISDNIQLDIWRKFLFITTVSGIGAITRVPFGQLQNHAFLKNVVYKTAVEITQVANAKNIALNTEDIDLVMHTFSAMAPETTASMQRDIMQNKPSELDTFNGYIVSEGKRLGVLTPTNDFIYYCLKPQEQLARLV